MKNKTILKENMKRFGTKNLKEGYAWERKADGTLPTLKDATKQHESNISEQEAGQRVFDNKPDAIKREIVVEIESLLKAMELSPQHSADTMAQVLINNLNFFLLREKQWSNTTKYGEPLFNRSDVKFVNKDR